MTGAAQLVSVITPVYNGADYLEPMIESVRSQAYPDLEHIIVDDGSQDEGRTTAVLAGYTHIKTWSRPNRGQYATMNEGLRAASGEWVCFISADDLMEPDAVARVMQQARQRPDCDVIYGKTRFVRVTPANGQTPEGLEKDPVQGWLPGAPVSWYAWLGHIYHCSVYVRRSALLEHGLFFEEGYRYTGDFDWMIRLVGAGLKFCSVKRVLASVRIHPNRASIVYAAEQTREHQRLLEHYRVNMRWYRLVAGLRYLRSVALETVFMLGHAQFSQFSHRVGRWFRNKGIHTRIIDRKGS